MTRKAGSTLIELLTAVGVIAFLTAPARNGWQLLNAGSQQGQAFPMSQVQNYGNSAILPTYQHNG